LNNYKIFLKIFYNKMSRYIVLNGQASNSANIRSITKISNPLGRQQWLNLFAKNPKILTRTDKVVILNNKSSSLTFRFNVSVYGNYDIFVRCIAPSTSTNTAIVKLDNSKAKILDLARRPRQYVLQQITIQMFSNVPLGAGVHKITFGYKEPIGLIKLFIKKKQGNAPPIVIPSVDVALNPNLIYTEPIQTQPPTEIITPEPIIEAEYITPSPEPIIPPIAEEPIEDIITPVEQIVPETSSPAPIYETSSPETMPIYETPSPEPIFETTSPKPLVAKASVKTTKSKKKPMATWKIVLIVIFIILILAICVYFLYRYFSRSSRIVQQKQRQHKQVSFESIHPHKQQKFDVVNPMGQKQQQQQQKQFVNPIFKGKSRQQFDKSKQQLSEQELYQSYRNLFKQYQQKLSEQEMFQSFRNLMQGKEQPPEITSKLRHVKTFPTRTGFLNLAQVVANAEKRKLKKPDQSTPIQINFSPKINVNTAQQKQKTQDTIAQSQIKDQQINKAIVDNKKTLLADLLKRTTTTPKEQQQKTQTQTSVLSSVKPQQQTQAVISQNKAIEDRIKIQNKADPNVMKALSQNYRKDKIKPAQVKQQQNKQDTIAKSQIKDQQQNKAIVDNKKTLLADLLKRTTTTPKEQQQKTQTQTSILSSVKPQQQIGGAVDVSTITQLLKKPTGQQKQATTPIIKRDLFADITKGIKLKPVTRSKSKEQQDKTMQQQLRERLAKRRRAIS